MTRFQPRDGNILVLKRKVSLEEDNKNILDGDCRREFIELQCAERRDKDVENDNVWHLWEKVDKI